MKRVFFALSLWFLVPLAAVAGSVTLQGVRVWSAPDNTRLVFELSDPVAHSLFTLQNPDRLVIDLKEATLSGRVDTPRADDRRILQLRHGPRDRKDLRVVLDLKHDVRAKSFLLKPSPPYGHRLVIDLLDKEEAARGAEAKAVPAVAAKKGAPTAPARDIVIAIDAGHGGEDPGAIGARGSHEKDVVLSIARRVERLVRAESGHAARADAQRRLLRRPAQAHGHRPQAPCGLVRLHPCGCLRGRAGARVVGVRPVGARGVERGRALAGRARERRGPGRGRHARGQGRGAGLRAARPVADGHASGEPRRRRQRVPRAQPPGRGARAPGPAGWLLGAQVPGCPVHAGGDRLHLEPRRGAQAE